MSYFQITPEGIFTLASVSDVTLTDLSYQGYPEAAPMYHIYRFHVRAKIQPATASSSVMNPIASATVNTQTWSQNMQKISGDPSDYFYKTINKFEIGSSVRIPSIAVNVKATVMTMETFQDSSPDTALPQA